MSTFHTLNRPALDSRHWASQLFLHRAQLKCKFCAGEIFRFSLSTQFKYEIDYEYNNWHFLSHVATWDTLKLN